MLFDGLSFIPYHSLCRSSKFLTDFIKKPTNAKLKLLLVLEIEPVKPQTHIMISYQWDVQETLIKVKNKLQQSGFNVWMDLEQMGGSTLEAMARAVENSSVVLVCVSQKYKESANCRSGKTLAMFII